MHNSRFNDVYYISLHSLHLFPLDVWYAYDFNVLLVFGIVFGNRYSASRTLACTYQMHKCIRLLANEKWFVEISPRIRRCYQMNSLFGEKWTFKMSRYTRNMRMSEATARDSMQICSMELWTNNIRPNHCIFFIQLRTANLYWMKLHDCCTGFFMTFSIQGNNLFNSSSFDTGSLIIFLVYHQFKIISWKHLRY